MLCGNTCANLQSSDLYCGNCTTQCNYLEGCLNGTCRRKNSSCADILAFQPGAANGAFMNGNDGQTMYCDFAARRQIELGLGLYTTAFPGWSPMNAATFSDPTVQAAFIAIYNKDVGIRTLAAWTPQYCCLHAPGNTTLWFSAPNNAMFILPSTTSGFVCNNTMTYDGWYPIGIGSSASGAVVPPMPATFFQTNQVIENTLCSTGANPGFFIKNVGF